MFPNVFGPITRHDVFQVLGVEKTSSEAEIKRGYHKASLKHHPDRAKEEDKEDATKK